MAQEVGKCEGINEIKYNVTLKDLNNFDEFKSNVFYVGGNSWKIKFLKSEKQIDNVKEDYLAISLCPEENRSGNWAILSDFTAKIISRKSKAEPFKYESSIYLYDENMKCWKFHVIPWKTLIDPDQCYVHNDTCKIIVDVRSSPMQHDDKPELIEMNRIKKCCDATAYCSFRLKVNQIDDFVNVTTPQFRLKNYPWRLLICKTNKYFDKELQKVVLSDEDTLQVALFLDRYFIFGSIKATMNCKLISSIPNIESISKKLENSEIKHRIGYDSLNIISWDELCDPENAFIENDSIILDVHLKLFYGDSDDEQEIDEAENNNQNVDRKNVAKPICPICYEHLAGKKTFTPPCGHIFCENCLRLAIETKPSCPNCNASTTADELRQVYLSME